MSASVRAAEECDLPPTGREWDAIRVQQTLGLEALRILGSRNGAVITDPVERTMYWRLVPAGTARAWNVPDTLVLGVGHHIGVPPPRRTTGPGPNRQMCPGDDSLLTGPDALRAALEDLQGVDPHRRQPQ
ncbi:hypothetical protein ABZ479_34530 [Streptomyces sp. NPDC005722]